MTLIQIGKDMHLENIKNKFNWYISNVSSKGHAASLELAHYTFNHCEKNKPSKVVDMGSGFTSYVLRYYKKHINPDAIVFSIDDDTAWMRKTRNFIKESDLDANNILYFYDFVKTEEKDFDFILYDMGHIPTRIENVAFPKTIAAKGATILYDDIHFDQAFSNKVGLYMPNYYQDVFYDYCKDNNLTFEKLNETIDEYGRYSVKVINE